MKINARFYVSGLSRTTGHLLDDSQLDGSGVVTLSPVIRDSDNTDWSKYTPAGNITMNVHDGAYSWFAARLGRSVAITFGDVE